MRTFAAFLLLLLCSTRAHADERWYIFSIAGTPVGYVSEDEGGGRTRTIVFARLTRLGKSIEMRFDTTTVENEHGDLQTVSYEAMLSKQPVRLQATIEPARIRISSPPAPERLVDRGDARLVGPSAIARMSTDGLRVDGSHIEYSVFSPELQRVARVRRRLLTAKDHVECAGISGRKIEETIEGLPAPRTVWLAADGATIADSTTGPFGAMTTCRATKEAALAANGTLPADLYERTLARANVRLADAGAIDRIVLSIRPRHAGSKLPDFAAHNQRVVKPGLVEIRRVSRRPNDGAAATTADREFVEPNALVESTHADIVRIASELKRGTTYETALALTKWTADNLSMDAGIVMAPASELIRDRKATCMGYATLLAALGRAAGLPSRIVMGYVYYGGIWGGHAWAELHVDGRWLPFDAAVFSPGIASAARLSVGASSLADGGGSLTGPLAGLFGNVDVKTIEYQIDGRVRRVEEDGKPYDVVGGTYINRGIGLRVRADGWTIEHADSTWPSTLVVAFRRNGTTIELHQKARYPERQTLPATDASFISAEGSTMWLWTARGTNAAEALRTFLTRVERVE